MPLHLTSTPRINYLTGDVEYVPAVAVVNAYGTPGSPVYFDCGETRFVCQRGMQYKFTHRIVFRAENMVCTVGQVFQILARVLVYDVDTAAEVPTSAFYVQAVQNIAGDVYLEAGSLVSGVIRGVVNFNMELKEGENELLIEGHRYVVKPQLMKEQSIGSPTVDLIMVDSVHTGTACTRLNR